MVLTCSSFSKTIAPGYRVGWLLAGKFAPLARRYKRALSCSSSLLNQWTLAELLANGEYRRNLERLRTVLMRNKTLMIEAVKRSFPQGTRISDPSGGSVIWVELPAGCDSQVLFQLALQANISIAPGGLFSPSEKFSHCIRLSYGLSWSKQIDQALAELGELVKELAVASSTTRHSS
jgi:DNA-binding transcriptional MocR family regulator